MTDQAELDLSEIFAYIAYTLNERHNAVKQLDRIRESINDLETMPGRYRIYEKGPWKKRNTNFFPVDHYVVFYTVDNNDLKVYVLRIMYSGRNIDDQMMNYTR